MLSGRFLLEGKNEKNFVPIILWLCLYLCVCVCVCVCVCDVSMLVYGKFQVIDSVMHFGV